MLKQYNTKVTSEEENIHVQQMYHKLGYNKRTTILTSQHMQDRGHGGDYVVGAVYASMNGYISVDSVENVARNFEDEHELTIEELEEMVKVLEPKKIEQVLWVNIETGELQQHDKDVKVKGSEWEVVPEDADVVVNLGFVVGTYKDQFKQVWDEGQWCNTKYNNGNIKIWNNSPILWQREGAVVKADLIAEEVEIEYSLFLNTLTSTVQTLPSHAGDDEGSALIKLLEGTEVVTQVEDVYLAWNSFGQVCSLKVDKDWRYGAHRDVEEYIKEFKGRVKTIYDVRAKVTVNKYENHLKHLDIFLNGGKVQFRVIGTKQWHNLTKGALQHITRENIEFRETPQMIVVDDISFEHKEDAIAFIQNKY